MRRVNAYKRVESLVAALDNGGRWYHLFSRADDGVVTAGELGKASGSWDPRTGVLFLTLAWAELDERERGQVQSALDHDVQKWFETWPPHFVSPGQVAALSTGSPTIVEGELFRARMPTPRPGHLPAEHHNDLAELAGFIDTLRPPRDVFELRGDGGRCLLSVAQGRCQVKNGARIRVAGVVDGEDNGRRWLAALLYSPADHS